MAALATLTIGADRVACYDDGAAVDPAWGPRPFLHPVTTLAGVPVTDALPEDHPWHLGVSVALQDVDGTNFWGGRTYRRDDAYQWRDDHGRVQHAGFTDAGPDGWTETLTWTDRHDRHVLTERRVVRAVPCGAGAWSLELAFSLRNTSGAPVSLGSPATNGREGGGYGGFFWRLPAYAGDLAVFTETALGEGDTHGSTEPWLAVSARDLPGRPWTVLLEDLADAAERDPWFVRVAAYPGVGSALAWSEPLVLEPSASASRAFRATIVDRACSDAADVRQWLAADEDGHHSDTRGH